mmetsp:Transcript_633/g.2118  ORF Transcript_633/g.2118 Transcript_633/m.2118 type:complete len:394 (+) Transcript_633:129-1310(+)
MGKDGGFLTPKAIANRIKAKGLQKLQFYCQMCQKQCRDANGFKCHKESESHQRMMLVFAENSGKYVGGFSDEFLQGYLDILRHRFGTKLVKANTVYQEYIKDRHHVHMNSTKWTTLSEFARWLGREGLCHVEEKEDGFYLSYVDREAAERRKKAEQMEQDLIREAEREDRRIERQIKKAQREGDGGSEYAPSSPKEFHRDEDTKVALEVKVKKTPGIKRGVSEPIVPAAPPSEKGAKLVPKGSSRDVSTNKRKPETMLDRIKREDEQRKEKLARKDFWLAKDIVVKVMNKDVSDGKFHRKKAHVVEVIDRYAAVVQILDSQAKLKLDQDDLETVIPNPGGSVLILNGLHRGERAIIRSLHVEDYCVSLEITSGPERGKILNKVQYEDVSRLVH